MVGEMSKMVSKEIEARVGSLSTPCHVINYSFCVNVEAGILGSFMPLRRHVGSIGI